ncbi:glycosyltransferase family A protein [Frigidibacter sp. MR17.14]|uniref:glycosyltransferase family 2 protein n=1 Tax=Frigidibacter sp. MR17.14 TaxID=3126509 RepID=UPI003012ABDA
MRVSVIIPVYRDWSDAQVCADALAAQTRRPDEVVFVNNDPATPPPAGFRLPPGGRILDETTPGSYAARNRALAEVSADVIFFTDADCLPDPGWIAAGLAAIEAGAARAGGPVRVTSGEPPNLAECYDLLTAFRQDRNMARGWSVTANMATRAELFTRLGGFEDRLMSGGDQEWGRRAAAAGFPIASVPAMVVAHPARASLAALVRKRRRVEGGKLVQKLDTRGRLKLAAAFLLMLPFRLLPSISSSVRLLGAKAPLRVRLGAIWVQYLLRLARVYEHGRLLLLSRPPERR